MTINPQNKYLVQNKNHCTKKNRLGYLQSKLEINLDTETNFIDQSVKISCRTMALSSSI